MHRMHHCVSIAFLRVILCKYNHCVESDTKMARLEMEKIKISLKTYTNVKQYHHDK